MNAAPLRACSLCDSEHKDSLKLFAIPFGAFEYKVLNNQYVLDVSKERLQAAPGFDGGVLAFDVR